MQRVSQSTVKGWWLLLITDRGVIKHVARAQQINNFRDLVYGKITPTDIDGLIEYRDKAYVIIEVKYGNKDVPYGQKLAIKRMVDDLSSGKACVAIICEHEVHDTDKHVDVSNCKVREVYFGSEKKWRKPNLGITTKQAIDRFINAVNEVEGLNV